MKWLWNLFAGIWHFLTSKRWYITIPVVLGVVLIVVLVGNWIANKWAFWDSDPDRGATIVQTDVYGDVANKIRFLDQGWSASETLWFDNVTQGSDLIPYDFFLVLEQPNGQLLRDNETMNNKYRYLVRKPTYGNPDGLPVGFVKDNFDHKDFLGYTCAACHTNQVNYKGTGIRIDGGPAMADMDTFLTDLAQDLGLTQTNPGVQARFVKNVMALGNYGSEDEIKADLSKYALRLATYRMVNHSETEYGFARLDAFGRIYNQVLQYVISAQDIEAVISQLARDGKVNPDDLKKVHFFEILKDLENKPVLNGEDRDRVFGALGLMWQTGGLTQKKEVLRIRDKIFNSPNAPVSYPFTWDIPQHDYVQWNGLGANAGLGPIGRNTGEVIGVFGTMDWSRSDHWTLAGVFSGQGLFNGHPINYRSSVNIHNLALIEDQLKKLTRPAWPEDILGKIDQHARWRGKILFDHNCATCHAEIDPYDPTRRIVAHMSALNHVQTDPRMATNGAKYEGYSGIVRNAYVTIGPGALLLDRRASVAALLTKTTTGVVATPDADKGVLRRFVEWLYDVIFSLRNNDIDASLKDGDYNPDTTAAPMSSLLSYKGRALDGIWATAPYLHNGSVPTLWDLLLPADKRPTKFMVGSREFDPKKVGFKSDGYDGFQFLTTMPGNSNAGHEYATHTLTDADRWDLIEYMKGL